MKKNKEGELYDATPLNLWPFKYSEFITEEYDHDQVFIIDFKGDDYPSIMEYDDLNDLLTYGMVEIKHYLPVNLYYE